MIFRGSLITADYLSFQEKINDVSQKQVGILSSVFFLLIALKILSDIFY